MTPPTTTAVRSRWCTNAGRAGGGGALSQGPPQVHIAGGQAAQGAHARRPARHGQDHAGCVAPPLLPPSRTLSYAHEGFLCGFVLRRRGASCCAGVGAAMYRPRCRRVCVRSAATNFAGTAAAAKASMLSVGTAKGSSAEIVWARHPNKGPSLTAWN